MKLEHILMVCTLFPLLMSTCDLFIYQQPCICFWEFYSLKILKRIFMRLIAHQRHSYMKASYPLIFDANHFHFQNNFNRKFYLNMHVCINQVVFCAFLFHVFLTMSDNREQLYLFYQQKLIDIPMKFSVLLSINARGKLFDVPCDIHS